MISPTSQMAFDAIKKDLERLEQMVWLALDDLGPTHDLRLQEYLQQAEKLKPKDQRREWPINAVLPRRDGLVKKGQALFAGFYRGQWNDKPCIKKFWSLASDTREPTGWTKLSAEEVTAMKSKFKVKSEKLKVKESPAAMSPSDFGRLLVAHRYAKREQKINQGQGVLFG